MAVQTNLRQQQGRGREHVIKYGRRSPCVRGSESAFHEGLVFVHSEIKPSHDEGLATVGHKHRSGQDCDRPHLICGCYKGLATSCNIKKCCLGWGHHHRTHCAPVCRNSDLDLPRYGPPERLKKRLQTVATARKKVAQPNKLGRGFCLARQRRDQESEVYTQKKAEALCWVHVHVRAWPR